MLYRATADLAKTQATYTYVQAHIDMLEIDTLLLLDGADRSNDRGYARQRKASLTASYPDAMFLALESLETGISVAHRRGRRRQQQPRHAAAGPARAGHQVDHTDLMQFCFFEAYVPALSAQ